MDVVACPPERLPEVLPFWRTAGHGTSISDDPAGVRQLYDRDPAALLVALVDDAIVGTVIAGWDGWRCHLYRLAVDPARRREGIASALLAAAERRFVALGGRRIDAMVLDANAVAVETWSALGYVRDDPWSRWIKPL